jgi:RHS repeat-associated protein
MTTAAICATRELSRSASHYRAEQYDSDLGLYYLRARYYNPATGRFLSRDPEQGDTQVPATLHKYLYANGDPINGWDPSGRAAAEEEEEDDGIADYILERIGKKPLTASYILHYLAFRAIWEVSGGKGSYLWAPGIACSAFSLLNL